MYEVELAVRAAKCAEGGRCAILMVSYEEEEEEGLTDARGSFSRSSIVGWIIDFRREDVGKGAVSYRRRPWGIGCAKFPHLCCLLGGLRCMQAGMN
jgi:hypothetical protein